MRGARILAETLDAAGVEYAFGVAGSAILGTIDALEQSAITVVPTRDEHVAATMATGYAMATRRPTVSFSHVGPGAANQILGIAAAYRENVPVVVIAGNEPSYRLGRGVRHEWDVVGVFERFTKHAVRVGRDRPFEQVRDAVVQSVTGMPGPVFIDMPRDREEEELPDPDPDALGRLRTSPLRTPASRSRPDDAAVEATLDLLARAERPLLIAGSEVRWFDATGPVRKAAEALGLPVGTTHAARGALSESHRLSLGLVGRGGLGPTNDYLREADLVIAAGARFSDLVTDNWELIDPAAALVHATVRPREIDRHYHADVNAIADPGSFLTELLAAAPRNLSFEEVAKTTHAEGERARASSLEPNDDTEWVDPRRLVAAIDRAAGDYTYTTGGGNHTSFPRKLPVKGVNGAFITSNFGNMSQGLPLAMGAALALDRTVITFEGDGGFAMVMGDLETVVREETPVKIVVMNNDGMMSQAARQRRYYDERYTGTRFSNPNFAAVAREFGLPAVRIEDDEGIDDAVDVLFDTDGPALVDARIDTWLGTGTYDRD